MTFRPPRPGGQVCPFKLMVCDILGFVSLTSFSHRAEERALATDQHRVSRIRSVRFRSVCIRVHPVEISLSISRGESVVDLVCSLCLYGHLRPHRFSISTGSTASARSKPNTRA